MSYRNGTRSSRPPEARSSAAPRMLEGKELLEKARSLSNRPEDQIARACGYVGPSGRVLKKSFHRALVEAKGWPMPESGSPAASKGRQAEFRTRVHGNGNLLVGQAYTRRLGLEPGQEVRIQLHPETGSIWLVAVEPGSSDGSSDDGDDSSDPGDDTPSPGDPS